MKNVFFLLTDGKHEGQIWEQTYYKRSAKDWSKKVEYLYIWTYILVLE